MNWEHEEYARRTAGRALRRKPRRNWKKFYQVWIRYKDDPETWDIVFSSPSPPEATEYARNRVSFGGVDRVEIRDYWGDSTLEVIYDSAWGLRL